MWTIPVEYRCSLDLYLTQLAVARLRIRIRIMTLFCLTILAVYQDWWDMMLFWAGMLLCELYMEYLARSSHTARILTMKPSASIYSLWGRRYTLAALHVVNLFSTLYFLSIPEDSCEYTPGFRTLCSFTSRTMAQGGAIGFRFWAGVDAIQLVAGTATAAVYSPFGRFSIAAFLSTPLSQYLGNISFALYCVHGLANHALGLPVWYVVFHFIGREKGWVVSYLVSMALQTMLTIWLADIFWRFVDKPCVALARKVEEMSLRKETKRNVVYSLYKSRNLAQYTKPSSCW